MAKGSSARHVAQRPLLLCEINLETFLLVIAGFTLYLSVSHFSNWIVFYCAYIFIPYATLVCLYFVASALLFFGVLFSVRVLVVCFVWAMAGCLIANVAYAVMIYVDQRCICRNLAWMSHGFAFQLGVASAYSFLGFMAGVNFVITLLFLLVVKEYLDAA